MARKEKVKLMKLKMTRFGPMAASSSVLAYCPTHTASTKLMMGSARGMERAGRENLRMRRTSSSRHCRRLSCCEESAQGARERAQAHETTMRRRRLRGRMMMMTTTTEEKA
eukprot:409548-Hanusia_phi.AAC.2